MTTSAIATREVNPWLLTTTAAAAVATVVVIVASGRFGLYEAASSVSLWVAIAPGAAWLAAGLVGWRLRPASRVGVLMTALGFSYFWPNLLALPGEALPFTVGYVFVSLPLGFAAHLYVVFPEGRARSALERRLIVVAYLLVTLTTFVEALFRDPARDLGCTGCPENLVLIERDPATADAVAAISGIAGGAIAIAIAVLLVRRWRAATPTGRRALGPVLATSLVTVLLFAPFLAVARAGEPISPLGLAAWLSSGLMPLAFLVGLLRARLQQGGVADLIVRLGAAPPAEDIRALVARTLGDPSVELAFPRSGSEAYVDASGRPVLLPGDEVARAVSIIDRDGTPLAALVHDRSLLENPRLLEGVSAAARLALENARLQAELKAQLREVRASRERVVTAGDEERRRIERNLHDGAQQRLLAIRLALRLARKNAGDLDPQLAEIDAELGGALEELRTLARGLHPPILTEQGLGPALETLARRAAIPVEIGALPAARLSPAVETAAYYVVSEGLTNAVKHAHATHVRIDLTRTETHAVVEVADDGDGGADPHGSGIAGLRDRVEALDGSLRLESPRGEGTMLRAEFPCA